MHAACALNRKGRRAFTSSSIDSSVSDQLKCLTRFHEPLPFTSSSTDSSVSDQLKCPTTFHEPLPFTSSSTESSVSDWLQWLTRFHEPLSPPYWCDNGLKNVKCNHWTTANEVKTKMKTTDQRECQQTRINQKNRPQRMKTKMRPEWMMSTDRNECRQQTKVNKVNGPKGMTTDQSQLKRMMTTDQSERDQLT